MGFHSTDDCFLCGDKFSPPGLRRRLKVFNQVHGDAPPPGHKIRDWDPLLVPPIHQTQLGQSQSDYVPDSQQNSHQARPRPFNNTKTKSNVNFIRSMEITDGLHDDNQQQSLSAIDPSISALVTNKYPLRRTSLLIMMKS